MTTNSPWPAPLPGDYLAFLEGRVADERLPASVLYAAPRDPGMALGKQGTENFFASVLVGWRDNGQQVVLTWERERPGDVEAWHYRIVAGAEWQHVWNFGDFAAMREFLRRERPTPPPAPAPRKRRRR